MTRRRAALVILVALACGAMAMAGAAATLGVSSRSIDSFSAAVPASTTTTAAGDATAPALTSLEMFDTNGNGTVDQVKATFNETLASSTATAPWSLTSVPSGGTLASVATSGAVATLTLNEGAGGANTAVGTFTVALAQDANGIRDAAGNRSSFAATAPADKAAPARTLMEMFDQNTNGKIDRVVVTFSEALASSPATTPPWTLANVPSGGTLTSVATSGVAATLTITEGVSAANTAVGSFTVALAANAAGIRDAAGNQSSFGSTAPTDAAAAVLVGVTDSDAGSNNDNGRFDNGDFADFLFSEPLDPTSLGVSTVNVLLDDPQGDGGNDYLNIPNFLTGSTLIGTNYLTAQDLHALFSASSVAFQPGNTTIRLTLATCSGNCVGDLGTQNPGAAITWSFVAALTAPDGLPVVGGSTTVRLM